MGGAAVAVVRLPIAAVGVNDDLDLVIRAVPRAWVLHERT